MADNNNPWFIRWPITAWCDALAAIEQMPWVFGTALSGVVVLQGLNRFVVPQAGPTDFGPQILHLAINLLQALLLTPAAIAVHRFVILQERTSHYRLNVTDPRTSSFFFCAVAIQALIFVPVMLFPVLLLALAGFGAGLGLLSSAMLPIFFLVAWALLTLRTLILFPAIAVDAPGAGWSNALLDTKGHTLRVLSVVIITSVPVFAVGWLQLFWLGRAIPSGVAGKVIQIVLSGVTNTVTMAVFAALASRIFVALANRLAGQAAETGPA
ncbi:hypothetical protein [Rhodoplanes sp. Z2-YC6860]|uniref:hypothetical protein n=1 Tax=Rhodoplanes sp. Z2-YC6860 TaxID=674703 RepID=UPI00083050FB|nr:hypothetical protein [Rhodoplanes sp. Z2-YC6860]